MDRQPASKNSIGKRFGRYFRVRKLRRIHAELREDFDARKASADELGIHLFDLEDVDLELCKLEERKLIPLAEKWGVEIPFDTWVLAPTLGEKYLTSASRARIRKQIEAARFSYCSGWINLLVPILSLLVALAAVLN